MRNVTRIANYATIALELHCTKLTSTKSIFILAKSSKKPTFLTLELLMNHSFIIFCSISSDKWSASVGKLGQLFIRFQPKLLVLAQKFTKPRAAAVQFSHKCRTGTTKKVNPKGRICHFVETIDAAVFIAFFFIVSQTWVDFRQMGP